MEKYNKISPQSVPDNYFESLSQRIMDGIKASNSAEDTPLEMLSQDSTVPFSVPEKAYFEQLSSRVMSHIKGAEDSEAFLQSINSKQLPFSLPDNYFDKMNVQLMHRIHSSDDDIVGLEESILNAVSKEMPYEIPATYFSDFNPSIPSHQPVEIAHSSISNSSTKPQGAIKVNFFRSMRWSSSVAAALVFLILGWGAFLLLNDGGGQSSTSQNNVLASAQNDATNVQYAFAQLDGVSNDALTEFIEGSLNDDDVYILMDYFASTQNIDQGKVEEHIMDGISSEDIQSFLEYEGML